MDNKAWYLSKLVWLGVIQTVLGALTVVYDFLQSGKQLDAAGVILIVTGVLEIVIRIWFTNTNLGGGQPPAQ